MSRNLTKIMHFKYMVVYKTLRNIKTNNKVKIYEFSANKRKTFREKKNNKLVLFSHKINKLNSDEKLFFSFKVLYNIIY